MDFLKRKTLLGYKCDNTFTTYSETKSKEKKMRRNHNLPKQNEHGSGTNP